MNEWVLKICLIGSSELKTTLSRRVADNKFDVNYMPTIGADITTKRITLNGQRIKLILVDLPRHEAFASIRQSYYLGVAACIIFFEKHDDDSFSAIPDWITDVQKVTGDLPLILVGIITDDPEQVSYASARKYALYWGMEFFALKVTDGPFFETLLADLVQLYLQKRSSS